MKKPCEERNKKPYEDLRIEVTAFDAEDVITESGGNDGDTNPNPFGDPIE